jgi:hypothetical protein
MSFADIPGSVFEGRVDPLIRRSLRRTHSGLTGLSYPTIDELLEYLGIEYISTLIQEIDYLFTFPFGTEIKTDPRLWRPSETIIEDVYNDIYLGKDIADPLKPDVKMILSLLHRNAKTHQYMSLNSR